MGDPCTNDGCQKKGCQGRILTNEARLSIFDEFNGLSDLQKQREFIVRHMEITETKAKSTNSRRQKSHTYFLTANGQRMKVCQTLFLRTLGITERMMRTAKGKLSQTGILEPEMRGGRMSEKDRCRDQRIRSEVEIHIDRFPRVESHYCRSSSTKEYLSPELTLPKMYDMFCEEYKGADKASYSTYCRVFKEKNLSFHHPKKDQCSLCMTYQQGPESVHTELKDRYDHHIAEKKKVREIKDACKKESKLDPTVLCANFDLEQVMYLPMSKENALFYKRRLSNFNLTFYNIGNSSCYCYTWHEGQSKRGSSEISTAVYEALKSYDKDGVKKAYLFSDGCPGQNKNTIMPAMMLYFINTSSNITEVSLRYFETCHGQSEGDSVHSAISTSLKNAGDVFVPSELTPIITLARRKNPYIVRRLQYDDFLDFKKLSQEMKILQLRHSDENEQVKWNNMMEIKVTKESPASIFYKTSHHDDTYNTISLKRRQANVKSFSIKQLNKEPNKLSSDKYKDLISLCSGDTPLVRLDECKAFYRALPHQE